MGKLANFFSGNKKEKKEEPPVEEPKKANKWPWEK